jgi:hypothetical protein
MTQLDIRLTVSSNAFALADRGAFRIGFVTTNRGEAAIDPEMMSAELYVNGEVSHAWNLAISNGGRTDAWFSLPPGESIQMSWPLGDALFPKAGEYHVVMKAHGREYTADVSVQ